ncbi:hypothetical protein Nepgr_016091 [Nepenthes gracilis]|uniref:Uncharacterized protein n=1 Tax=Nepenthes gracilis TaxID=150966 RepID=A0AAD3XS74_NEPGR|nr:hypothetical protein Nepgr_016091 [Nepenthes gracilis]
MPRRCSHCSNNGHNSRTCASRRCGGGGGGSGIGGGLKLFGVSLTDGSLIKKSASMGNLSHYHSSSSAAASPNPGSPSDILREPAHLPDGYLSDDPNHASCSSNRSSERKKGVPWTEEEHRLFLIGLKKLGKGDWRGIARQYVVSRTPTQVASHAQKHFIRQSNANRRKRRSSLFDMVPDMVTDAQPAAEVKPLPSPQAIEPVHPNSLPSLDLRLSTEAKPMEADDSDEPVKESPETVSFPGEFPPVIPTFFPAYISIPYPFWQHTAALPEEDNRSGTSHHEVLKPTPVLQKAPVDVHELVGMSHLNLSDTKSSRRSPPLPTLSLLGAPSTRSAFHARSSASVTRPGLSKGTNSAIKAV